MFTGGLPNHLLATPLPTPTLPYQVMLGLAETATSHVCILLTMHEVHAGEQANQAKDSSFVLTILVSDGVKRWREDRTSTLLGQQHTLASLSEKKL